MASSGATLTGVARVLAGETDARLVAGGKGGAGGWVEDGVQPRFGGGTADGHYAVFGPGRTDLALNRTASAAAAGFSPSAAVDADPATRWRGVAADGQWLQVDLGVRRTVSGVQLTWGANHATRLRVQLSDDGSTWRDVWATTNGTGGTQTVRAGGVARFVRLSLDARASAATGVELAGLSVWGD